MSRSQPCMVIGFAQRSRVSADSKVTCRWEQVRDAGWAPRRVWLRMGTPLSRDRGVGGSRSSRQASSQASLLSGRDSWSPEDRETLGPVVPPSCPGATAVSVEKVNERVSDS